MKDWMKLLLAIGLVLIFVFAVRVWSPGVGEHVEQRTDAMGQTYEALPEGLRDAASGLGLLLLGSWFFGRLMKTINLPKISGYLIFGLVVGPGLLGLISREQMEYLELVNDLAISLIALTAGGEIHLGFLRKSFKVIALVTAIMVPLVLISVGVLFFFLIGPFNLADLDDVPSRIMISIMVATVATSCSPAVVIAIITELRARGLLSQTALSIVVTMDLILVVMFAIVITIAGAVIVENGSITEAVADINPEQVAQALEVDPDQPPDLTEAAETEPEDRIRALAVYLAIHLGGSLLAGVVLGLVLAWYVHRVGAAMPIFVILACFGIALLSDALGLEALLVALVAGLLMQNAWPESSEPLFGAIENLSLPVYCVFFSVAGAKLEPHTLAAIWPAVLMVVLLRAVMIWISTKLACRMGGLRGEPARWLWTSLIPQAGVSLALAAIIQRTFEGYAFADNVYSFILATIGIHELIGPILYKLGLTRAGEAGGDRRDTG